MEIRSEDGNDNTLESSFTLYDRKESIFSDQYSCSDVHLQWTLEFALFLKSVNIICIIGLMLFLLS